MPLPRRRVLTEGGRFLCGQTPGKQLRDECITRRAHVSQLSAFVLPQRREPLWILLPQLVQRWVGIDGFKATLLGTGENRRSIPRRLLPWDSAAPYCIMTMTRSRFLSRIAASRSINRHEIWTPVSFG